MVFLEFDARSGSLKRDVVQKASLDAVRMTYITQWRTAQLAQSLSARTVKERVAAIERLGCWLGRDPSEATTLELSEWLADNDQWSESTRSTYFAHLRAYYAYLHRMGHRDTDPTAIMAKPRRPRSVPHPIADEHMPRLLATNMRYTSRMMILLAALAGLRAHEVARVRGEDVDLEARTLRVKGKGGFTATLPLHQLLVDEAQNFPQAGYWFPAADGNPRRHMRGQCVSMRIKAVMVRAGVPGTAHSLRHWFGTTLVDAGTDLRVTQELLRHQSLANTQIYVKVSDRRRAEGIALLDPWRSQDRPIRAA